MPGAMINRRLWYNGSDLERIRDMHVWANYVDSLKVESSPLNVGVSSSYNLSTKILTVNIEIYFTANVPEMLKLYTCLNESGIVTFQEGADSNYVNNHVFREAFPYPTPGQWGDSISPFNLQGNLKTFTFTFNNTETNYDMSNCEIIAFVRNAVNDEIISGNGAPIGSSSPVEIKSPLSFQDYYSVFPNPLSENAILNITLHKNAALGYQLFDVSGKMIVSKDLGWLNAGNHIINLNTNSLGKGIYFIQIRNGINSCFLKVIK